MVTTLSGKSYLQRSFGKFYSGTYDLDIIVFIQDVLSIWKVSHYEIEFAEVNKAMVMCHSF